MAGDGSGMFPNSSQFSDQSVDIEIGMTDGETESQENRCLLHSSGAGPSA